MINFPAPLAQQNERFSLVEPHEKEKGVYIFQCPGCGYAHQVHTITPNKYGALWTFNGNKQFPTVLPSILVNKDDPSRRCHSYVKEGNIQFLPDCWHNLKGQTVPIPEWDESKPLPPDSAFLNLSTQFLKQLITISQSY